MTEVGRMAEKWGGAPRDWYSVSASGTLPCGSNAPESRRLALMAEWARAVTDGDHICGDMSPAAIASALVAWWPERVWVELTVRSAIKVKAESSLSEVFFGTPSPEARRIMARIMDKVSTALGRAFYTGGGTRAYTAEAFRASKILGEDIGDPVLVIVHDGGDLSAYGATPCDGTLVAAAVADLGVYPEGVNHWVTAFWRTE